MGVGVRIAGSGMERFTLHLESIINRIGDAEPAFKKIADVIRGMNKEQFAQAGAYYGQRWEPLTPRYAAWKSVKRPGVPIMVFDGLLKESLTGAVMGVEETTNRSVTAGTQVEYGRYHQDGVPQNNLPARPLLGDIPKFKVQEISSIIHRFIVEGDV